MDENKEVNTTDPKREKVRVLPLSAIDDAPDHPFGVRDDEEMAELVESISTFGVINPVIPFSRYNDFKNRHGGIMNMSNKSQTVFAVCFGLFLAVVVTVSLLFADKLPHATQCKGGREVMSLRDFTLCIKTINAHLNLACFSPDGSRESKRHLKMADDICLAVEDCFADQNSNLVNWFRREPCEFHHPLTENDVKVEVRDDIEAIYYFLHYCMVLNQHKPIDEDTLGYLAYILCEPAYD